MTDPIRNCPGAPEESLAEETRKLRIHAAAVCSDLAVTLFALLETRAVAAQTLEESRRQRRLTTGNRS
jgi:hypothetical protein